MQCKYYKILLGWTCEWSLWRDGRFIEVVFKAALTVKFNLLPQNGHSLKCLDKSRISSLEG